jgi:hypothetical protein
MSLAVLQQTLYVRADIVGLCWSYSIYIRFCDLGGQLKGAGLVCYAMRLSKCSRLFRHSGINLMTLCILVLAHYREKETSF